MFGFLALSVGTIFHPDTAPGKWWKKLIQRKDAKIDYKKIIR